ncbi:MAG: hypothetical protein PVJ80_05350 [Gemmatimonadota bacterium]|jgi:polyhydroxyalkanoate synthesis regulator phasin
MTEEGKEQNDTNDTKGTRERMGDGIRSGIGILSAFKDTVEESIREARERGDLSADRAKELLREAMDKAQSAASGARDRLDFVSHGELEALQGAVQALTARVSALEARVFEVEQEQPADAGSQEESPEEGTETA